MIFIFTSSTEFAFFLRVKTKMKIEPHEIRKTIKFYFMHWFTICIHAQIEELTKYLLQVNNIFIYRI